MQTDTTITDKKDFRLKILDKEKFSKLSIIDQKFFEIARNSMIEIFPFQDFMFNDLAIQYAENFAFIQISAIHTFFDEKFDEKMIEIKAYIDNRFTELNRQNGQ